MGWTPIHVGVHTSHTRTSPPTHPPTTPTLKIPGSSSVLPQDRLDTALQGAIRRAVEGAIAEQAASEAEREAMLRAWRRQVAP